MNKFNIRTDSRLIIVPVDLLPDYERDPEKAHRDFGARVTRSTSKFLKDVNLIKAMFTDKFKKPWNEKHVFYSWFVGNPNFFYHAHIDLGQKNDACGMALGHQDGPFTIIDFAESLNPKEIGEIDFEEVRMIFKVIEQRGFGYDITFDSWNSVDSIQQFQKRGIEATLFSLDKDVRGYTALKHGLYEHSVKCYYNPVLEKELRELDQVDFDKVDHPTGGSKDLSDAVAAVTFHCREDAFHEITEGAIA